MCKRLVPDGNPERPIGGIAAFRLKHVTILVVRRGAVPEPFDLSVSNLAVSRTLHAAIAFYCACLAKNVPVQLHSRGETVGDKRIHLC